MIMNHMIKEIETIWLVVMKIPVYLSSKLTNKLDMFLMIITMTML